MDELSGRNQNPLEQPASWKAQEGLANQ